MSEEERFLSALFTGDKPFVTYFLVILVDADLDFLLMELEFRKDLSMESARFWRIIFLNLE